MPGRPHSHKIICKSKIVPMNAIKACGENGVTALLILNFDLMLAVRITPRPLYLQGNSVQYGGRVCPTRAGVDYTEKKEQMSNCLPF